LASRDGGFPKGDISEEFHLTLQRADFEGSCPLVPEAPLEKTTGLAHKLFSCHLGKALARTAGGCTSKALAEYLVPTKSKLSQTLKNQPAFPERYRYRLEGNGHPWRKPRGFEAKLR
jgi:hypothetical protein